MILRNVTESEIAAAAVAVRALFGGGVIVEDLAPKSKTARAGGRGTFRVKLGVESSSGPGSRRAASGRRVKAACWHVFGHFFDALPGVAIIDAGRERARPAGAPWVDSEVGGGLMFSGLCKCGGTRLERRQLRPVGGSAAGSWVNARVPAADVPKVPAAPKVKAARPFDVTGAIIAYEGGEATEGEVLALFSHLIATGMAWGLQGSYGRAAARLIEAGVVSKTGEILRGVA